MKTKTNENFELAIGTPLTREQMKSIGGGGYRACKDSCRTDTDCPTYNGRAGWCDTLAQCPGYDEHGNPFPPVSVCIGITM